MTIQELSEILKCIKKNYISISEITEIMDIDDNPDIYKKMADKREMLLLEIHGYQNDLDRADNKWRSRCEMSVILGDIYQEIQYLISSIISRDYIFLNQLHDRIKKVKYELCQITQNSKIVASYIKNR